MEYFEAGKVIYVRRAAYTTGPSDRALFQLMFSVTDDERYINWFRTAPPIVLKIYETPNEHRENVSSP